MVKAVLSAMPLHFAQALRIPKGVIKHIDQMRRSFLWKGNKTCRGINCLVNWEKVCMLRQNGGMGIINIQIQNEALLAKWLWKAKQETNGYWSQTMMRLYGTSDPDQLGADDSHSFFIKSLRSLSDLIKAGSVVDSPAITRWRFSTTGLFTTASAYKIMHDTGIFDIYWKRLWEVKAPPKVKIFFWLLIRNRILTQHILARRDCAVITGCKLCANFFF